MVDGTGLENQQINVSQVRILSLPPSLCRLAQKGGFVSMVRILSLSLILFRCCEFFRVWRSW